MARCASVHLRILARELVDEVVLHLTPKHFVVGAIDERRHAPLMTGVAEHRAAVAHRDDRGDLVPHVLRDRLAPRRCVEALRYMTIEAARAERFAKELHDATNL